MKSSPKKAYIALAIIVLLSVGIGAFVLVEKNSKIDNDAETQAKPYIFFTLYRGEEETAYNPERTIELWMASTEPGSMYPSPVYIEPGKYAFDLLPSEERFYLGYCDQTGKFRNVENLGS